jgi:chromate transporter
VRLLAAPSAASPINCGTLFLAFLKIGLCGFGGVATWARRVIVEEREWLDDLDYAELLGVASILPGANTVNIAVLLGDRSCGFAGSLSAICGLLLMPIAILFAVAALYQRFSVEADVKHAVAGAGAATAGLVIGTGLKMMRNLKPDALALISGAVIFIIVGLFQAPLSLSLLCTVGISLILRAMMQRHR